MKVDWATVFKGLFVWLHCSALGRRMTRGSAEQPRASRPSLHSFLPQTRVVLFSSIMNQIRGKWNPPFSSRRESFLPRPLCLPRNHFAFFFNSISELEQPNAPDFQISLRQYMNARCERRQSFFSNSKQILGTNGNLINRKQARNQAVVYSRVHVGYRILCSSLVAWITRNL